MYEASSEHDEMEADAYRARQARKKELMETLDKIQAGARVTGEAIVGGSNGGRATGRELCLLAHTLLNKMSVVLGSLDLLDDMVPADSDVVRHLGIIRVATRSMADEVQAQQCRLTALLADRDSAASVNNS